MQSGKNRITATLAILIGSLSWSLTMVKSGLIYPFGMGFWGPNGHDGVWHVALINHLAKGSFEMPVFAGETLKNYHWFYDGFLALVHFVTRIPAHTLYFQIFPPILALLTGWLTYKFVLEWRKSATQALLAVFFVYFGGSWGWLVSFLRGQGFGGESMFWSQQAVSTLINPPYAASVVLFLAGLLLFLRYQKKPTKKLLFLQAIVFGILIQVKAYAGVIALTGLFVASLWDVLRNKLVTRQFSVFAAALLIALLVFLPTNRGAGSLLHLSPMWLVESMLSAQDRFYWPRLASAISTFKSGGFFIKLLPAEILALSIFLLGNFGTRITGLPLAFRWIKNWRKLDLLEIFISSSILVGLLLPLLFIQKGNPWNTIQFLYYSLFLAGIITGVFLGGLWEKSGKSRPIVILVILLTLPTSLDTLFNHYLPGRPPAKIPHEELAALSLLREQPQGAVLTYPYFKVGPDQLTPPAPLYLYESTSYVSAFSQQLVYLEDEVNLTILGYDFKKRREEVFSRFFEAELFYIAKDFLRIEGISYIYLVDDKELPYSEKELEVEKIFEEGGTRVYRIL